MHIRCPHCRNAIEIVEDSSFRDVECPSCRSHFNLVGGDAPTESGPTKPRTLGHFELIEQLGVGHFGAVWKAKDTALDRFVAVKIPRKDQLDEADTEKFFREARAAAQLRHPNIVGVHEVGRDGDTIFIASDYVEGATLKDWLGGQPLPPREAAKLCAKIANALHVAHEAGVIHRDLKPGNIMMDMDDEPHIMDFGLAKRESGEITVTIEGALLGTPAYMPPEQAAGKGHEADRRSDVYSLGVILFEMLTGELPFRGEKRMLLMQVQRDEPPSPRKLNGNIPRDLETICLKCLEKSPDKRYKLAGELPEELNRYLDGKPIKARRIGRVAKGWRWAKRNPVVAGSVAAVMLVTCVAIAAISYWATVAASKSEQAVRSLVESLANAPPTQVPDAINALRPFRADAIGMLQQQFDATSGRRHLNTAYGLAAFGNVERQFLIKSIDGSESGDCDNLVLALACDRNAALDDLRDAASAATSNRDWELKTRLATVALFLNDASIAAEMLRGEADKNQTPQKFPNPLETLREQLASSKMPVASTSKVPVMMKMLIHFQMAFRLQRATACYYLDRPRHALEDLNQLADESSQALLLQALCLAREGKADEAAEAADKLAEAVIDQRYASYAASGRILSQAWLGNTDQADRQFEELLEQGKDDALAQYSGACIAAQLARIQADADPTEAARLKKRALELLRRAYVELGYKGSSGIDNDPDLAPLYDDPEFQALAFELMPPVQAFDPVERTEFIKEFAAWCGEIERLVGVLEETNNAHLRSGMSLAIGGSERPSAKAKEAWGRVFTRWYQNAPDSGTHSAAAWALRQWPLSVPPTTFTDEPSPSRDWWHASEDLVMVRIPSGHLAKFSSPQSVRVDEFWLSDREVTVRLFRKFIADTEYAAKYPGEVPSGWDGEDSRVSPGLDHPVQQVSWYDAVMFCNWLSRSNDLDPYYEIAAAETTIQDLGRRNFRVTLMEEADGFRLPTGDAWTYACRASTTTRCACGNDDDNLRDYAVFGVSRAEMCGSKRCNAWGLFDMHGNAWEWCSERYGDYFHFYAKSPEDYPRALKNGSVRVNRGGGWSSSASRCQSAGCNWIQPSSRDSSLGFRVARVPSASKPAGGARSDSR